MNLADLVYDLVPAIAEQLGTDLEDAKEFSVVTLYALESVPALAKAAGHSLVAAILTAAKMRLAPHLGLGRFSVLRTDGRVEALFSPSWRGFLQLLHDHAGVVDATCESFYERDRFSLKRGPHDTGDKLEFEPCTFGPRGPLQGVFVRLEIETRTLQRLSHVEVLWRHDLDPVTPDANEPPDSARGFSKHDYVEFVKTVCLKRAAKWCAARSRRGASLIAAAIELERGTERSNIVPSAERVAKMLGIDIPPVAIAAPPSAALEEAAREIDEEKAATKQEREEAPRRCCTCKRGGRTKLEPVSASVALLHPCKGDPACSFVGLDHVLCRECMRATIRAATAKGAPPLSESLGVEPESHDLAPDAPKAPAEASP